MWQALGAAAILAVGIPVLAQSTQEAPESLLPPGFGDPVPPEPAPPPPGQPRRPVDPMGGDTVQPLQLNLPGLDAAAVADAGADNAAGADDALADQQKYDLPPDARRSTAQIGALTPETGGMTAEAFGNAGGRFLTTLLRDTHAPFASRWASILLRRTLLSSTATPRSVDGADWVAERAWLLLRMGEADGARLLVQNVDPDRYSKRLYAVAMQSYLATGDPAGLCPIVAGASLTSEADGWQLAKAMCSSFAGDQGLASAALNQAQRANGGNGIDYRLAEKIVGAGLNARRSVTVEWTGVDVLTAWRFGLATAANLDIPPPLFATVGQQVRAWQARSAMLSPAKRLPGVELAARLGVFSSDALVDFYSELATDSDAPPDFADMADALRTAYSAGSTRERVAGMRTIWDRGGGKDYLGAIATARAAANIPVNPALGADAAPLIASMLAAGYDRNAAQWVRALGGIEGQAGIDAWGLLAVGAPDAIAGGADRLSDYVGGDSSANGLRGRMLAAGMAGLGRISVTQAEGSLQGLGLGVRSPWTKAIDEAAARGEQGTVALLVAAGMQTSRWDRVPAFHLYHMVAALRRVGLEPEARMIAAEAVART